MKEIDFERAAMLMDIVSKVASVSPMLTNISGEAGEELKAIQADCQSNARERADKIRQEEQVAQQQALQAAEVVANEKQPNPNPPNIPSTGPGQPTVAPTTTNPPLPVDRPLAPVDNPTPIIDRKI